MLDYVKLALGTLKLYLYSEAIVRPYTDKYWPIPTGGEKAETDILEREHRERVIIKEERCLTTNWWMLDWVRGGHQMKPAKESASR